MKWKYDHYLLQKSITKDFYLFKRRVNSKICDSFLQAKRFVKFVIVRQGGRLREQDLPPYSPRITYVSNQK